MTPILVTGAGGFLGRRVLSELRAARIDVVGTERGIVDGLAACDLADAAAVKQLLGEVTPAAVIHCAAIVPRTAAEYDHAAIADANHRMVENLLPGTHRICFMSSMTVYPDEVEVAREQDARAVGVGYAAGKLSSERALLSRHSGDAVVLRLPGLFGPPRESGLLFNAALAFARNRPFVVGAPAPRWAALHIDDAARMIVRSLDLPAGNHVLNIGHEGRMATADAVDRLAIIFGRTPENQPRRWFEFDLARTTERLGRPAVSFDDRLNEMADWARAVVSESGHARAG